MSSEKGKKISVKTITGMGVLTAVVIILQLFGSSIRFGPFSISLVNVPVAMGAILYGLPGGSWLGLVFGLVVLLSGDANLFFAVNIPGTILTVLVKGTAAGFSSALLYRFFREKNRTAAAVLAAMACPVVNTGVFLIGCLLFFLETVAGWAQMAGMSGRVGAYMILVLVGGNFIAEFVVSAVLTPVILRLLRLLGSGRARIFRGEEAGVSGEKEPELPAGKRPECSGEK